MRRGTFRLCWFGMSAGGLPVLAAPAAWEGPVFVEISAGHAVGHLDAFGIVPLALGSCPTVRPVSAGPGQQATSPLRRGVRKNSVNLDVACPVIQIRTLF